MAYGESIYGTISFGANEAEDSGPVVVPKSLMHHLPDYWKDIRDMVELQDTLAKELPQFAITDLNSQSYLSTATWGIELWEQEFGLATDPSMSYEWRREIITAKIRGHGTVTKQKIISAAYAFSGGDVEIDEYPKESRFVVRFVGILGIPANMAGFIMMLEQMKPAHLTYTFEYSYTTWANIQSMKWSDAGKLSWGQLRTVK